MEHRINFPNWLPIWKMSENIQIRFIKKISALISNSTPCQPSPCGPNSQCKEINNQAVCSCLSEYTGSPPSCRPECTVSSECQMIKACVNQKCSDPCPGNCGVHSNCQVINHSPICSCKTSFTGDPFTRCYPIPRKIL